jgi:hypothetical protein
MGLDGGSEDVNSLSLPPFFLFALAVAASRRRYLGIFIKIMLLALL